MKKLTEDEKRRIALHRKVAPPITVPKKVPSQKGQIEFDLEKLCAARRSSDCDERPSDKAENITPINGIEAISYLDQSAAQSAEGGAA